MTQIVQDRADSAPENAVTTAASMTLPEKIQTGQYSFRPIDIPPGNNMKIVVDSTTNPNKTSIWGRFQYDHKDIVFFMDDISTGFKTRPMGWLSFEFVWRARSIDYGSVMIEDSELRGDIRVYGPERDIGILLGGANMGREASVDVRKFKDIGHQDASSLVEEIKELWEGMGRDPNKVDMELLRKHHGCIMSPQHIQMHHTSSNH